MEGARLLSLRLLSLSKYRSKVVTQRYSLRQAQGPQRGSRLLSLSKQGSDPAYSLRYSLFGQAKRQADYRTSCSVFSSKTLRTSSLSGY